MKHLNSIDVNLKVATICIGEVQVDNSHRKLPQKRINVLLSNMGGTLGLLTSEIDFTKPIKDNVSELVDTHVKGVKDKLSLEQLGFITHHCSESNKNVLSLGYLATINQKPSVELENNNIKWFNMSLDFISSETSKDDNKRQVKTSYYLNLQNDEIELNINCIVEKLKTISLLDNAINTEINIVEPSVLNPSDLEFLFNICDRLKNDAFNDVSTLFKFLPQHFTLKEYQSIFELFTGKDIDPSAFRRKVAGLVVETDQREYSGSRKAKLYKREINQ